MNITIIGIDLAKNVFQVHGVDERTKVGLKKQLKQESMQNRGRQSEPNFCGNGKHVFSVWSSVKSIDHQ